MSIQTEAAGARQATQAEQVANFKENLVELEGLLADETGQPDIKAHMLHLQKALRVAPHIAENLLPEEVGLLVGAIRSQMTEDLLAAKAPTVRKKAAPKVKMPTKQELANMSVDDLFG